MDPVEISYHDNAMFDMTNVTIHFKDISVPVTNEYITKSPGPDYVAADIAQKVSKMVYDAIFYKVKQHVDTVASSNPQQNDLSFYQYYTATSNPGGAKVTWDDVAAAKEQLFPSDLYTGTSTKAYGTGSSIVAQLKKVFGDILDKRVPCPACNDTYVMTLGDMIQHLNDSPHNWLRENIADWLETLDIDINAKEENNDD